MSPSQGGSGEAQLLGKNEALEALSEAESWDDLRRLVRRWGQSMEGF